MSKEEKSKKGTPTPGDKDKKKTPKGAAESAGGDKDAEEFPADDPDQPHKNKVTPDVANF